MRFYIATKLENHAAHNVIRDCLHERGWRITYDWTTHGPVWRLGEDTIRETAVKEVQGVSCADVVVVLWPGGRGTHVELGAAIALGKRIVIHAESGPRGLLGIGPETCAFYWHPQVILRHSGPQNDLPRAIVEACV